MPNPSNPQSWDRYSYVNNNPLRYTDPTGHIISCEAEEDCKEVRRTEKLSGLQAAKEALKKYKVSLKGDGWTDRSGIAALLGVMAVGNKLGGAAAFQHTYGSTTLEWGCSECSRLGQTVDADTIQFRAFYGDHNTYQMLMNTNLVIHELGHMLENVIAYRLPNGELYKPARSSLPTILANNRDGLGAQWIYQQSNHISGGEIFADMFVGWTQDKWALNVDGSLTERATQRSNWMDRNMPSFLGIRTVTERVR